VGGLALAAGVIASATAVTAQDSAADPADVGAPWAMRTIQAGLRGADGAHLADVDGDGFDDVATAWEEQGVVTVSLHPGAAATPETLRQPWTTVVVGTRLGGVEDAVVADIDEDGHADVVSACECRKLAVHFAPDDPTRLLDPEAWTTVTLDASTGGHRWIKAAVTDVDGDGHLDVVGGGKASPATVSWFRSPADPRDGSAWTRTVMSDVGWTMSLEPLDVDADTDVDLVLSDRIPIRDPDRPIRYDLRGSRWLENPAVGGGADWVNHPIGFSRGEHKFLHVVDVDGDGDDDVLDGVSGATHNRTFLRKNLGGWTAWEETPIPQPDGVGHYQDVTTGDIDADGDLDLAFSYSHAEGDLSGVIWLGAGPDGSWQRNEISGPPGTKFDNVELHDVDGDGDLDAVTTEQIEQLGIIWYENPA
jgi:hypothetical protein